MSGIIEWIYAYSEKNEYFPFLLFVMPYVIILFLGLINRIRISRLIRDAEENGRVVKAYLLHFSGNSNATDPETKQGVAEYKYSWKGKNKKYRLHLRDGSPNGIINLYYAPGSNTMHSKQDPKGGNVMLFIPVIVGIELLIILKVVLTGKLF